MNTGADDDSLSTPIFAFSASSARASPVAAIASSTATASRAIPARMSCSIQFPPSLTTGLHRASQAFRELLISPDKGALLLQLLLQLFYRDVTRDCIATERQRRGGACRLAHRKTRAGDARRRLPIMGHRGAASGHQQIIDTFRNQHAIRQFIKPARFRDRRKLEDHVA